MIFPFKEDIYLFLMQIFSMSFLEHLHGTSIIIDQLYNIYNKSIININHNLCAIGTYVL